MPLLNPPFCRQLQQCNKSLRLSLGKLYFTTDFIAGLKAAVVFLRNNQSFYAEMTTIVVICCVCGVPVQL